MLLLTFKSAGFIRKQERLCVIKSKPAACFSHVLAAEPVSGESQVWAAHGQPRGRLSAGRTVWSPL